MNQKAILFIFRSWWLLAFLVVSFIAYYHTMKKKDKEIQDTITQLEALEIKKEQTLEEKEDLLSRIQAQSDPEWIEMVLMRELGVVPEGKIKVHFK